MPSRRLVLAALLVGIAAGAVLMLVLIDRLLRFDIEWSETLHVAADVAVVLAVLIGLIEWYGHRGERLERTAAIDAHIQVLTVQALLVVERERNGRTFGALLERLANRGEQPGDLLATWFTTIAAEAPQASPALRRRASQVSGLFFGIVNRVARILMRFGRIPDDGDKDLHQDFNQLLDALLTSLDPAGFDAVDVAFPPLGAAKSP